MLYGDWGWFFENRILRNLFMFRKSFMMYGRVNYMSGEVILNKFFAYGSIDRENWVMYLI